MPTRLIQPPRLVEDATSGLTVTTRCATWGAACARSVKKRPNVCWVEVAAGVLAAELGGRRRRGRARRVRAREAEQRRGRAAPRGSVGSNGAHGSTGRRRAPRAKLLPRATGEQGRMVRRVALDRQPPGLDREGEDHGRAVEHGVGLGERVEQEREVVAAKVAEGGRRPRRRRARRAARSRSRRPGPRAGEPLAQRRRRQPQRALVLLVAHRVDPPAQRLAARAREQLLQPAPVLDGEHLPSGRLEHSREPADRDVGHDPVERLAVDVDDPEDLAEAGDERVDDRLPAARPRQAPRRRRARSAARPAGRRSARRHSGARSRSRSALSRRSRPTPSRSRPGPDPCGGSDSSAGRRTRAASSGTRDRASPAGTRSRAGPGRRAASPRRGRVRAGARSRARS